jgi:hypothetical protein
MANRMDGEGGSNDAPKPIKIDKNLGGERPEERVIGLVKLYNELLAEKERIGKELAVTLGLQTRLMEAKFKAGGKYPEGEDWISVHEIAMRDNLADLQDVEKRLKELTEYSEGLLKKIETKSE